MWQVTLSCCSWTQWLMTSNPVCVFSELGTRTSWQMTPATFSPTRFSCFLWASLLLVQFAASSKLSCCKKWHPLRRDVFGAHGVVDLSSLPRTLQGLNKIDPTDVSRGERQTDYLHEGLPPRGEPTVGEVISHLQALQIDLLKSPTIDWTLGTRKYMWYSVLHESNWDLAVNSFHPVQLIRLWPIKCSSVTDDKALMTTMMQLQNIATLPWVVIATLDYN